MPSTGPESARKSYKVPAENLDLLKTQVDVVNRRVARLVKLGHDVARVEIRVGDLRVEKVYSEREHRQVERVYVDVELLSPEPPRVEGWEFVAVLTHVEDVGTVLRVCPGAVVSEGELRTYREASSSNCDHCHTSRKRNDTFIVRDREGRLCQVGRQCLAAYTGLANPAALCACAEILFACSEVLEASEDDDFGGSFGAGGQRYVTIAHFLPFVCCSIREDGWLSRGEARERGSGERSTCDLAFSLGVYADPKLPEADRYVPTEKDYNLASAVVEFCEDHFAGCDVDALSDYENSLRVAMASGIAHPKFAGLVASSVGFYKRDLEKRERRESWAEMVRKSRFQGVVGERGVFEGLRVLSHREWGTDFGVTHFYSFCDGQGNAFAYFASRDMDLEVGQTVSLRGTVKRHEVRTPKFEGAVGYEQTTLTRCSLAARARVVSQDEVEQPGPMVASNPDQVKLGIAAEYVRPVVRVQAYHLEGLDGRRFVLCSRSRKKALKVGVTAVVVYDPVVEAVGGEQPASLVLVV